jgi:DNA-binding NtrC family response regulator
LVVEDDENVRNFTVRVLNKNGYRVRSATNAEDALRIFNQEKDGFDLVISDVVLPGKTGIELVDQLLSTNPNLRVLLGSGYMDDKSQWNVIREKGYSFIQKPYIWSELSKAIEDALTPN